MVSALAAARLVRRATPAERPPCPKPRWSSPLTRICCRSPRIWLRGSSTGVWSPIRDRHLLPSSCLGNKLGAPFHEGDGVPGDWWFLDEPEPYLGPQVLVQARVGRSAIAVPPSPRASTCGHPRYNIHAAHIQLGNVGPTNIRRRIGGRRVILGHARRSTLSGAGRDLLLCVDAPPARSSEIAATTCAWRRSLCRSESRASPAIRGRLRSALTQGMPRRNRGDSIRRLTAAATQV